MAPWNNHAACKPNSTMDSSNLLHKWIILVFCISNQFTLTWIERRLETAFTLIVIQRNYHPQEKSIKILPNIYDGALLQKQLTGLGLFTGLLLKLTL